MCWRVWLRAKCLECHKTSNWRQDFEVDSEAEARKLSRTSSEVVLCPDCDARDLKIALDFEDWRSVEPIPSSEFKKGPPWRV